MPGKTLIGAIFATIVILAVFGFSIAGTISLDMGHSSKPEGLCVTGEKQIFGCKTEDGNKISLCRSQVVNKHTGWIKYRYGYSGAVRTEYPSGKSKPQPLYRFHRETRFQYEKMYVRFKVSGSTYKVFQEDFVTKGARVKQAGVRINPGAANAVEYKCSGPHQGDISQFETLVPNE